jgi:TolB-like protein
MLVFFLLAACTNQEPAVQSAGAAQTASASPFYTGDGGKGKSIAILPLKDSGLTADQNYLPALVQGEFVSNFKGYSAIDVLDRAQLDNQYAELLSGYYDENAEAGLDLGHLTPTDYILGGTIIKTATGYAMQIQITQSADKMTAASYSGPCTFTELDNLTGIRQASLDLLEKMGVQSTERTRTELTKAAAESHVSGQTALARGITAQRRGTVVEAWNYYYEAARFEPALAEAASRVSAMSAVVVSGDLPSTTGTIGSNVRNAIQQYRDERERDQAFKDSWLKVLREAAAFYRAHPPYVIVYDPSLTQGEIDLNRETVDISFTAGHIADGTALQIIADLEMGLERTGRRQAWGLESWPRSGEAAVFVSGVGDQQIIAALLDEGGKTIGAAEAGLPDVSRRESGSAYEFRTLTFRNVQAGAITDTLTAAITSVNGVDAKAAGERGYIGIAAFPLDALVKDYESLAWRNGGFEIGAYKGDPMTRVTIPNGVTAIGEEAFGSKWLDSVFIPPGVTFIGAGAFQFNRLAIITLPDSLTAIEHGAFWGNKLTIVTIPDSVTAVGKSAFGGYGSYNKLTSVTIPANVEVGECAFDKYRAAAGKRFETLYNGNGKRAGTYTKKGSKWSYQP